MNSELLMQGLMIAAIGMGLVFVVIIFLWGLMALLMRLTSNGEEPMAEDVYQEATDGGLVPELEKTERQRRAAAAAVAVGLALTSSARLPADPKGGQSGEVSPWQAFHRSRGIEPEERRGK